MSTRLEHNPFMPPHSSPARMRAWLQAAAAHSLLAAAMLWTVRTPKPVVLPLVQAEFWEVEEKPPPPAPQPAPVLPPPTQPTLQDLREAEIALEKKRQQEREEQAARAQAAREQEERAEAERQAAAARARAEQTAREKEEAQRQAAAAQARAEQVAREKAAREAKEKAEAEKLAAEKKAAEERRRQQQAQAAERRRQENIRRMQDLARSSAPSAGGQPSQEYVARVAALIRSKINYTELHADNPLAVVRVRAAADGRIVQINLMQRSGTRAWDDAVVRALQKTPALPRDDDGRIPATDIIIDFRPND